MIFEYKQYTGWVRNERNQSTDGSVHHENKGDFKTNGRKISDSRRPGAILSNSLHFSVEMVRRVQYNIDSCSVAWKLCSAI